MNPCNYLKHCCPLNNGQDFGMCWGGGNSIIKANFFCASSHCLPLRDLPKLPILFQTDLLLDKGCNSWTTNKNGESALDLACRFGHVHVCIFTNLIPDEIWYKENLILQA